MKFLDVKAVFANDDIIDIRNIINRLGPLDRRRLYEWQKKGYLLKLCNNFYIFSSATINDSLLRMISNKIYEPSYVGLESALSFYGLIPEAVFQSTCITTRKTKQINTPISNFSYRSIHKKLFWGYSLTMSNSQTFLISDLEKTLLDYLYLNPHLDNLETLQALRLNRTELQKNINPEQLQKYLSIFSHNRLNQNLNKLIEAYNVKF
ncbi:MAG: hypothetical protein ABH869_07810 [Candidatus Omnitrophota bacterium]